MPDLTYNLAWARSDLADAQRNLGILRRTGAAPFEILFAEKKVLAALSWVWDEQERQRSTELQPYYDVISEGIRIAHKATLADFARRLLPKTRARLKAA